MKKTLLEERIAWTEEYIKTGAVNALPLGRNDLAEGIYVNICEYTTKPLGVFEAHKKWADIHYMIDGEENVITAPVDTGFTITQTYNEEKDYFLGESKLGKDNIIKNGEYVITAPDLAHIPSTKVTDPIKVKKAIFKIRLD